MQRIDQQTIIDNLLTFLSERVRDKQTHHPTESWEIEAYWANLTAGACHGFSICRAAMRITGKLDWWEAALKAIATWDGKLSSLQQSVLLPQADDNKPVSLETIFDRIANYIIFNHGTSFLFPPLYYEQQSFTKQGGDFQILQESQLSTVNNRYSIGGHFTVEDLAWSLEDEATKQALEKNICLVCNFSHACELSYSNHQWHFYDPNYEDGKAKSFNDTTSLATEIINRLEPNITIQMTCMQTPPSLPFPNYCHLLRNNPDKFINGMGLLTITNYAPKLLPYVIHTMKQGDERLNTQVDPNGNTALLRAVTQNDVVAIKLLLDKGADPNCFSYTGLSPLYIAKVNNSEAAQLLIEKGANQDLIAYNQPTLIQWYALNGRTESLLEIITQLPNETVSELIELANYSNHYVTAKALSDYQLRHFVNNDTPFSSGMTLFAPCIPPEVNECIVEPASSPLSQPIPAENSIDLDEFINSLFPADSELLFSLYETLTPEYGFETPPSPIQSNKRKAEEDKSLEEPATKKQKTEAMNNNFPQFPNIDFLIKEKDNASFYDLEEEDPLYQFLNPSRKF